jgi:hypothetical protein
VSIQKCGFVVLIKAAQVFAVRRTPVRRSWKRAENANQGQKDHFGADTQKECRLLNPGPGEIAALLTALSWTATMMAFEAAGKRIGSFFGPFVGVSLSLYAVQHTQVGIAATIIALVPIFIIPPSMIFKKEKIGPRDVIGALLAVGGSALLFV